MEFLSIIIDRVGNTNVFNLIQGRLPAREIHLHTLVDDDLLQEFLLEIERLSRISNSVDPTVSAQLYDVTGELRKIGETFFQQFFPDSIKARLRSMENGYLFFHVDESLRTIPWELLHDGSAFLSDRFYIGKSIEGLWSDNQRQERERLRMLIVSDPTEDLDWARREGEELFEALISEVNADRLDVQLLSGKRVTKLNLLAALKDRDIIHYAGHVKFSSDPGERGWLLHGDRILKAREIEMAGFSPDLVFSNSCLSSAVQAGGPEMEGDSGRYFNDLAGAFLKAGIQNYIGTNWEIKDNPGTYSFALQFYRSIFEEKSVGEALYDARQYCRRSYQSFDITWANYVMHGNPMIRIFRSPHRRTFDASRNVLMVRRVLDEFPTPVANRYSDFMESDEADRSPLQAFELILRVFESVLTISGAFIFGTARLNDVKSSFPTPADPVGLYRWTEICFETLSSLHALKIQIHPVGLRDTLFLHRDTIFKLLEWRKEVLAGQVPMEILPSYVVTFQYLVDNLLSDLTVFRKNILHYLLPGEENNALVLHGSGEEVIRLLPVHYTEPFLKNIEEFHNQVCFFQPQKKLLFSLEGYLHYDLENRELHCPSLIRESVPTSGVD